MAVVMTAILILRKKKKSTPKEGEGMKVSCYIITPPKKIGNNIDVVQNVSCHSIFAERNEDSEISLSS